MYLCILLLYDIVVSLDMSVKWDLSDYIQGITTIKQTLIAQNTVYINVYMYSTY